MTILAPSKRGGGCNVKIRVKPDGSGVDPSRIERSANPFDETAPEEAVRMKEVEEPAEPGAGVIQSGFPPEMGRFPHHGSGAGQAMPRLSEQTQHDK